MLGRCRCAALIARQATEGNVATLKEVAGVLQCDASTLCVAIGRYLKLYAELFNLPLLKFLDTRGRPLRLSKSKGEKSTPPPNSRVQRSDAETGVQLARALSLHRRGRPPRLSTGLDRSV